VAGQIGQHHTPGAGIFPHAGPYADVLVLVGDPDAKQFEGSRIGPGGVWDTELIGLCHEFSRS
jgi:hypothetical protein